MLVWPHQMWLTGITAGIILEVIAGFWNIWTMCALPHNRTMYSMVDWVAREG